ncbi:hypothetical protein BDA96_10G016900 [Sorghum bicolor]|uniref:Late embryogenesis abundant protein LEA-2 subgroup domain-containing protein n=2 Tax=Sorghum bicolor TaxID=4558 RepID=C5Z2V7_SORBI|nr:hypothetical protein SORBI_3010G014300 [Sorghum bicolor]KAG0512476.1 hypothetical protein BDA96_10G016900 [Sorghum bicolor]
MTTPLEVVPWMSRWSTKQYILAALLGMLAMVAVVAAISISLAPAHVALFVRDANITHANKTSQDGKQVLRFWYYNLTLVANNTSHRTAVSYGSLAVEIWRSETEWVPTEEVNTSAVLPGWLPPGNTSLVKFGVEGGQSNQETAPVKAQPPSSSTPAQGASGNAAVGNDSNAAAAGGVPKWPDCRVVVEAKVWFRFAGVPTLPYTVRVSCFPVNFLDGTTGPVNCTG